MPVRLPSAYLSKKIVSDRFAFGITDFTGFSSFIIVRSVSCGGIGDDTLHDIS